MVILELFAMFDTTKVEIKKEHCYCDNRPSLVRRQKSCCYGYAFRDFLGKYAKDFSAALEPCVGVPLKRKG